MNELQNNYIKNQIYTMPMKINQELINKAYENVINNDQDINDNINEIHNFIKDGINNMNIR